MEKGWYEDPKDPDKERWWTGSEWSSETRSGRGRSLQEAGKRSSEQDLRPRRRRRRPSDVPDAAAPTFAPMEQAPESIQEPVQEPAQEPIQEPIQEPVQEPVQEPIQEPIQEESDNYEEAKSPEEAKPSFVELPAAKKDIGKAQDWEEKPAKPRPKRSRRTEKENQDDFQSFEELEEPGAKRDVFASFEKETPPKETVWEKEEEPKPQKRVRTTKASEKASPRKDKKPQKKKPQKEPTKKEPRKKERSRSARKKPQIAAIGGRISKRLQEKRADRKSGEPSSLRIATKRFLPIAAGLILVIGGAAVIGPLLEGEDPPPKTLQDRLSNELAAKRKAARDPYPGVDRCIRNDGNVNSVLRERNDSGQWEWKVIYVDKNYQLITVTLNNSPAEAKQSAELAASSFLSASGGPFSIEGPIKGLAGGDTSELETISRYMSKLSDCLAETKA